MPDAKGIITGKNLPIRRALRLPDKAALLGVTPGGAAGCQ